MKGEVRCLTQSEFVAFYPQFTGFTPAIVMTTYIAQANERFGSFTETDAEEARRLYTAHRLTLYARVALPDGTTPSKAAIAAAGQAQQKLASKKVGEVSVTYSSGTSSTSSAQTDLADLTETSFGLQLLSLLKLYSMTRYVP
jgi:hypothetical protein